MVIYTGSTAHEPTRTHAVALYCSDGRFGDACEDFLRSGLHLSPFDRVTLPGGQFGFWLTDHLDPTRPPLGKH